ncbi:hypothetical protein B0A63_04570 [Flavobacterium johnsoniae UW101]|nr:hypothetical protein B0A63_04570 [Flavobacterium johnsoniae UW101]
MNIKLEKDSKKRQKPPVLLGFSVFFSYLYYVNNNKYMPKFHFKKLFFLSLQAFYFLKYLRISFRNYFF